jgi:hypothetical protein
MSAFPTCWKYEYPQGNDLITSDVLANLPRCNGNLVPVKIERRNHETFKIEWACSKCGRSL